MRIRLSKTKSHCEIHILTFVIVTQYKIETIVNDLHVRVTNTIFVPHYIYYLLFFLESECVTYKLTGLIPLSTSYNLFFHDGGNI